MVSASAANNVSLDHNKELNNLTNVNIVGSERRGDHPGSEKG